MSAVNETVTVLPNGKNFIMSVTYAQSEVAGVKFLIAVSVFSFLAVLSLLVSIAVSAWNTRKSINPYMFTRSHSCAYLVSMLICDLLQAIGSIMNSAWTKHSSVTFGTTCVAQGVIKHIADVGPAIWSLAIAGHTFWILFLHKSGKKSIFLATLIGNWSLIAILVLAGPATMNEKKRGSFYGISGHWCWISDGYPVARIMADYFWMFFSAFLCFILYGMILLKLRGNIISRGWRLRFVWRVQKSELDSPDGADSQMKTVAKQMLLYPIAYTIIILPIACCRFVEWSGHKVSWGATIFSDAVYLLSGVVNVILFLTTRRVLPPHTVITRRISYPAVPPFLKRFSGIAAVTSTTAKAIDIEEASVDLEKATFPDHEDDFEVKQEQYTMEYSSEPHPDSDHLTVPPVSPLRPESVSSATLTVSFPNPGPHLTPPGAPSMPVPAPAPTPVHQRSFHDVPLNTPVPGTAHGASPRLPHIPPTHEIGDDYSDYSASPSTAGYHEEYAERIEDLRTPPGLNRLSEIPLPSPHSDVGHDHH